MLDDVESDESSPGSSHYHTAEPRVSQSLSQDAVNRDPLGWPQFTYGTSTLRHQYIPDFQRKPKII